MVTCNRLYIDITIKNIENKIRIMYISKPEYTSSPLYKNSRFNAKLLSLCFNYISCANSSSNKII